MRVAADARDALRQGLIRGRMRFLRTLWRLPLLLLHVTLGLAITVLLLGPLGRALRWRGEPLDQWVLRTWSRLMIGCA